MGDIFVRIMKILIVDDEVDICEILQYNLENEGYEVDTVNSAEEALELPLQEYGLFLLDVMMGEMSGFQLARRLKADSATLHIPIIFITALDGEDNLVKGLNIGADDYIAKPLSMKEVKARVKAVLRRVNHGDRSHDSGQNHGQALMIHADRRICYEGLALDLDAKTVTLDDKELMCTKQEFELLSFFLKHPNRVFSREDLLKYCWPHDVLVLNRTVDVNITRLRKKIGRYGKQIKTRAGYGYCFERCD